MILIADFDKFVIGSSIRYGKHNPKIINFINEHKQELKNTENAFFSVNLVARKTERATPETNPYFIKFLQTIDWIPNTSAVFCRQTRLSQLSFYRQVDDSIDNVDDK